VKETSSAIRKQLIQT